MIKLSPKLKKLADEQRKLRRNQRPMTSAQARDQVLRIQRQSRY